MKNNHTGMTLIVKTITRVTVGLILIYGVYIVLQAQRPGGGFAGGVIIALSLIQLLLAFGKQAVLRKINQARCVILAGIGALAFLLFVDFRFFGSRLPLCDIAIALMVGMGLSAIFLSLALLNSGESQK